MLFLLVLLLPFTAFCSSIIENADLELIKKELEFATPDDLIIFDVDNTLFMAKDLVLRPCGEKFFLKQFESFSNTMPESQIKLLGSKILLKRNICAVNEQLPRYIQQLQRRSLKVIALTSLLTGPFGAISSLENWRTDELKSLGYDFSKTFPRYTHIVFGDLMKENSLPIYKDGVLFSSYHTRGEILLAFFRRVKWQPAHIYYIDDDRNTIDSIYGTMTADKIDCKCFHYRAVEAFKDILNEEIANKQFTNLRTHEEWLDDTTIQASISPSR